MRSVRNSIKSSYLNEEENIKMGQIYIRKNDKGIYNYYILSCVSPDEFNLIDLSTGQRFTRSSKEDLLKRVILEEGFILIKNNTITIEC